MANPGDEWAAGDIPPEPELTPETPRPWTPADCRVAASRARLDGHSDVGEAFDLIASAWVADRKHIEAMEKALREIAKGEGRFSRDPLTHASNTVEDMKAIAAAALRGEEEK